MTEIDVGKVGMISPSLVDVEDRARQEMGDLMEFENNLKSAGLIQPLAVMTTKNGRYRLLAGERRYTILLKNQVSEIPVRIFDKELSPLQIKVIEKSENFYRKDMEYWEYDNLIWEIDQLQGEIKGRAAPGPGGEGHRIKDTAEMFGVTEASVSIALKRAEAREAFPELFEKCKTQKDATKVIKKVDEAIVKDSIARKLEADKESGTVLSKMSDCYIYGDFFEGVKKIPDGVMHLVEIDPPYAIDLVRQKKKDGESNYQLEDYNEVEINNYAKFIQDTLSECYRVMADHSWLICWFAPEPWFEVIWSLLMNAGFQTTRMCGIWTKGVPGQNMNPTVRLSNSYEMFFYAWKGKPALNRAGSGNEFRFPPVPAQQKTHPTERPIELMKEIYDTFAFAGSRILIPFLGSGNGLIAAYELGMTGVGFELSKGYRDSFLVRVNSMR